MYHQLYFQAVFFVSDFKIMEKNNIYKSCRRSSDTNVQAHLCILQVALYFNEYIVLKTGWVHSPMYSGYLP